MTAFWRTLFRTATACAVVATLLLGPAPAQADTLTIKRPGARPRYDLEIEPHLLAALLPPPGVARDQGIGIGARGSFTIVKNGFIQGLNNSVAVSAGLDWVYHPESDAACLKNDMGQCVDLNPDISVHYLYLPLLMQWNFWLSRDWSVFGEPGLGLRYMSKGPSSIGFDPFLLNVGGRYHFADRVTLTMRLGWPVFSVGASFLF